MRLSEATRTLLAKALAVYQESPELTTWLHARIARLDEPLRIAVAGPPQTGKSTLVNALIGEAAAPVEAGGGQPVTRYRDGPEPRATLHPYDEPGYDLPVSRSPDGLYVDPADRHVDDIDEVVVRLPVRSLRHAHLVDTPPLTPGDDGHALASRVLHDADAVLYLTRHLGDADLWFLRAAQAHGTGVSAPINMLGVLSRADETAGGRIDALVSARRSARRRRRDHPLRELCQNVVAVTPLLAYAGATLRESEYAALAAVAGAPRDDVDGALLSADRFVGAHLPLGPDRRQAMLDRFGVPGLRLATTLIRTGCRTREHLSRQLVRRSGLAELRQSVSELFLHRSRPLKARSTLLALASLLRAEPWPGSEYLAAELDRLVANAHAFHELWLLAALRTGRVTFPDTLTEQARRLAGGDGTGAAARLGLPDGATEAEVWTGAEDALVRWRRERDDPLLTADQRRAVDIVVRCCEGMLRWAD